MRSLAFLSTSPVKASHNSKALRKKYYPKGGDFFSANPQGLALMIWRAYQKFAEEMRECA
ncbi:MAG TPA: hypothetical protein VFE53_08585 [Mucilaginibacter sp.]|nr:hypothetical protein [Mucilaginibacter sp.]